MINFPKNFKLYKFIDIKSLFNQLENLRLSTIQQINILPINENVTLFEIKWLEITKKQVEIKQERTENLFIFKNEGSLFYSGYDLSFINDILGNKVNEVPLYSNFINAFIYEFKKDIKLSGIKFMKSEDSEEGEVFNVMSHERRELLWRLARKNPSELYMQFESEKENTPFIIDKNSVIYLYDTYNNENLILEFLNRIAKEKV